MKVQEHLKMGFGLGLLLTLLWSLITKNILWGIVAGIFSFLGSGFPDLDHPFDFLWRTRFKNFWNLKYVLKGTYIFDETYLEGPERKNLLTVFPLHTAEFLLIMLGLWSTAFFAIKSAFLSAALIGIFYGTLIHITLDIVYTKRRGIPKSWSLIEYHFRKKKRFPNQDQILKEMISKVEQELEKP